HRRQWHSRRLFPCPRYQSETRGMEERAVQHRDGPAADGAAARHVGRWYGLGRLAVAAGEIVRSSDPAIAGVTPGGHQPRFPGFDVLAQIGHWDPVTAGVVLDRLSMPADLRFFTLAEEAVARPLVDALLDQHEEPRIPVLEMIDSRLAEQQSDGWHYSELPRDPTAWKRTIAAIDDDAHSRFGHGFAERTAKDRTEHSLAANRAGDQEGRDRRAE